MVTLRHVTGTSLKNGRIAVNVENVGGLKMSLRLEDWLVGLIKEALVEAEMVFMFGLVKQILRQEITNILIEPVKY